MAVAQMPGNANERADIRCGDLDEWLGRRLHPYNASVAQDEAVAIAEHDGLRQVEQEHQARLSGHCEPAAVATVEIQADRIRRDRLVPCAGGTDLIANHTEKSLPSCPKRNKSKIGRAQGRERVCKN